MDVSGRSAAREREIVRQTAELLSLGVPLAELFERFCTLLAEFVDASVVFIALKHDDGASIEFAFDHGLSVRDAHVPVSRESQTWRVLESDTAVLMKTPAELPAKRIPFNIPGAAIDDTASAIFVPLRFGSQPIGVLSVQTDRAAAYDEDDLELMQTCALYVAVAVQAELMRTEKERVEAVATVDAVTGAATRRVFDERFFYEWNRARRAGTPLAVIFMDIDRFKAFNDEYGHIAGDACLAQVAQAARSCIARSTDLFARYGGEEFAAILCDTSPQAALAIAERMREAIVALQVPHKHSRDAVVTASFGVACALPSTDERDRLIKAADRALYAAKAAGRNRVSFEADFSANAAPGGAFAAGNLTAQSTPFIGRAMEMDALVRSLAVSRLTTIAGAGGMGKTRCAQAAGRQLAHAYAYGAWFVDLSGVRHVEDLALSICTVLAIPASQRAPLAALTEFLEDKHCLLILDNCEQFARAAGEIADAVVERAPRCTLLATSREPLRCASERVFRLGPLAREDAARLFCDRAAVAAPASIFDARDRADIERICARLDDLPLAIELAAPRVKTMTPAQLLAALDERFDLLVSTKRGALARQRTLEATIEWSYALLNARAQMLFDRLSVFAGAFDGDAARDVCSFAGLRPGESAAALDELVEKNLIVALPMGERYLLLESMRHFAAARLRERGEALLAAQRHIEYYLALAERLAAQLSPATSEQQLAVASQEWPEFRAALDRAISEQLAPSLGERLVLALAPLWSQSGRTHEARAWIARVLETTADDSPRRNALVYAAASAAHSAGDFVSLRGYALELIELANQSADEQDLGAAYNALGNAELHLGNAREADELYERALEHHRKAGDKRGIATVLMNLGTAAADLHLDFPAARERFVEALALFRELGISVNVGIVLANIGEVEAQMGNFERALSYANQSVAVFERLNNRSAVAWQSVNIAHYYLGAGAYERSRASLAQAHEILRESPNREYSASLFEVAFYLLADTARYDQAARMAGYVDAFREREAVPRLPSAQRHYDERMTRVRASLGAAFADLYAAGRSRTSDELTSALFSSS